MKMLFVLVSAFFLAAPAAAGQSLLLSKDITACESLAEYRLHLQGKQPEPHLRTCITVYKGISVEVIGGTDEYLKLRLGGQVMYGPQLPLIKRHPG